jgi:hypothetical protein
VVQTGSIQFQALYDHMMEIHMEEQLLNDINDDQGDHPEQHGILSLGKITQLNQLFSTFRQTITANLVS